MARQHRPSMLAAAAPPAPCISVERLESRVLMAVTITVSRRGRLNIFAPPGDTGGDVVEVVPFNGQRDVQVFLNGIVVPVRPNSDRPDIVRRNRIRRIVADMGGGDDEVYIGARKGTPRPFRNRLFVRCTLSGGDGNDILQAGRRAT